MSDEQKVYDKLLFIAECAVAAFVLIFILYSIGDVIYSLRPTVIRERNITKHEGWMQIWHCDDGTFQLRTEWYEVGRFATLEDARLARHNRAVDQVDRADEPMEVLKACGKKVE